MPVDALASARFALDVKGLDGLKRAAVADPKSQLKEAARQFEAVFLANMLKSMRDAGIKSDLVDHRQNDFYQSLLDQQLAQNMSGKGHGLAELLIRQLSRQSGAQPDAQAAVVAARMAAIPRGEPQSLAGVPGVAAAAGADTATAERAGDGVTVSVRASAPARPAPGPRSVPASAAAAASTGPGPTATTMSATDDAGVGGFVNRFMDAARAAAQRSGLPALLILAQAALETGWGRHEVTTAGGANSHNLFGIKAGAGWSGATAVNQTTEYVSGQWTRVRESFRAYGSYLESFLDHARLIGGSPRYAAVQNASTPEQAARALQDCGYATDPRYADKLIAIMQQISRSGVM